MLARALSSVAAQTFGDFEVIIVDDGSTDGTPAFLASLTDPRYHVVRHERALGVSAARNRGIKLARGAMITFLDDDDALRAYALEMLQARCTLAPQVDFLWGGRLVHELDTEGRSIGTREDDWSHLPATVSGSMLLDVVLRIATNTAFTIRRSVLDSVGGFDETLRVSEDRDMFIALARERYVGAAIARSIIDVYERGSSLSRGAAISTGPAINLRVIEKNRAYLYLPEHRRFLDSYLAVVFVGFLDAGDRAGALRTLGELRRRGALSFGLLRLYLRHAPEFRALKVAFRYDSLRRYRNMLRRQRAP
jgi:glycosyltransferase involved in cell wall biosynthesis